MRVVQGDLDTKGVRVAMWLTYGKSIVSICLQVRLILFILLASTVVLSSAGGDVSREDVSQPDETLRKTIVRSTKIKGCQCSGLPGAAARQGREMRKDVALYVGFDRQFQLWWLAGFACVGSLCFATSTSCEGLQTSFQTAT
ncbi:hypothetical protein PpBr36_09004 [Pyricularia pennisetigena]|uniref:hypothetical protein n=1 Tax=Pyricularia pennisetigena TaxID=1578925 RepID=UPI00114F1DFF|nr:hypothetical protein PpBr36_09004 [Pyricularia pennisetigena]TLS23809.1 hypothetical protein PpBr36_09004 [Pyricularia pennisetigena]